MYLRNSAGFDFSFNYRDVVIFIPFDGKIYSIPDDVDIERINASMEDGILKLVIGKYAELPKYYFYFETKEVTNEL